MYVVLIFLAFVEKLKSFLKRLKNLNKCDNLYNFKNNYKLFRNKKLFKKVIFNKMLLMFFFFIFKNQRFK